MAGLQEEVGAGVTLKHDRGERKEEFKRKWYKAWSIYTLYGGGGC